MFLYNDFQFFKCTSNQIWACLVLYFKMINTAWCSWKYGQPFWRTMVVKITATVHRELNLKYFVIPAVFWSEIKCFESFSFLTFSVKSMYSCELAVQFESTPRMQKKHCWQANLYNGGILTKEIRLVTHWHVHDLTLTAHFNAAACVLTHGRVILCNHGWYPWILKVSCHEYYKMTWKTLL